MAANTTSRPPGGTGPLYDAAHFSTAYLNVPPNMHRLRNALGLTAGLYLGRKTMDILVGETLDGKKIDPNDLPVALRPVCGILPYDHFSDKPADRWMKVLDMLAPGVVGGFGAAAGSVSFYKDSFMKPVEGKMAASAANFSIMDAERRALYDQSKPWSLMSGTSSVFGSASGFGLFPSPFNYSATLGTLFTMRAERSMANSAMRPLFNGNSPYPFRPTKLVASMIEYAAGNRDADPKRLESYARGIIKTWFKGAKEENIKAFVDMVKEQRSQFLKEGRLPEEAEAKVREALKQMLADNGLEKSFIKAGLDPREAAIGDMGFVSTIAHTLGDALGFKTTQKMEATRELMREGLELRHPELKGKAFDHLAHMDKNGTAKTLAAGAFLASGVGAVTAISNGKDIGIADLDPGPDGKKDDGKGPDCHCPVKKFTERVPQPSQQADGSHKHIIHSKKQHGFVNGKLLDTAEGLTGMLNASIGMHRIHCAVGLTVGSWFGDEVMKALTGVTMTGAKVKKEDVLKPLQKMYKALAFNPHGDSPHDKWMQVLRWGVPGVIGTAAVIEGSKMFFEERTQKLKKAQYLDEVEDKATMAQSKPWSYTSAISGLFGFPSGMPMLPLVNYSTNLGTRFSMASGRKVVMPGLGKLWSNNETLYPYGPSGMIDLMVKEAVNNKSANPELLETFAVGILKPWFENVTPEQVEAFVNKVHETRDRFFQEGGVPSEMKKELEKELKAQLHGAGLHDTLQCIGLDPLEAHIANNGLSGKIADMLGAKNEVSKITEEYRQTHLERLKRRQENPPQQHLSA